MDVVTDSLKNWLNAFLHVDWLSTAITVVIVLTCTAVLAHIVKRLMRQLLRVDKNPLPASTIFVNVARGAVWVIGICVVLGSCFDINISAAVTALGIGGIAVSLGFQDTLKNLIAGLQVSLTKLVVPGDHIRVGTNQGIVDDVTWRHTRIFTTAGERVIIPNSLMNTDAVIRLLPQTVVRIPLIIHPQDKPLTALIPAMEQAVNQAVQPIVNVEEPAKIYLSEVVERGYKGTLAFAVTDGANLADVKTAALKAVSEHASA